MLLLWLLIQVNSIQITQLPKSGSSPPRLSQPSSCKSESSLIIFGGTKQDNSQSSSLYTFNISTSLWTEVQPYTSKSPSQLSSSLLFMSTKQTLIVLFGINEKGISEEKFAFDFIYNSWNSVSLTGDFMIPTAYSANYKFTYNGQQFLAVYGGMSSFGLIDDFYLYVLFRIDREKLEVLNLKSSKPGIMIEASLVFYNQTLWLLGIREDDQDYCELWMFEMERRVWELASAKGRIGGRKAHMATVFGSVMFVFFGRRRGKILKEVWKIDLEVLEWEKVGETDLFLYGSAVEEFDEVAIFACGSSLSNYENQVIAFNYSSESFQVILESVDFPDARKGHFSFSYRNEIIIFGGVSNENKYLNDMWKYNIKSEKWTKIMQIGEIPEGREQMAYNNLDSNGIIIFGGKTDNNVFSDLFFFEPKSSQWIWFNDFKYTLGPRYSSCILQYAYKLFIFGGSSKEKNFKDLWVYDIYSSTFIMIPLKPELSSDLIDYKCHFETTDTEIKFFLIGGSSLNQIPNNKIYEIIIKEFLNDKIYATLSIYWENDNFGISNFALDSNTNQILIVGGKIINEYSDFMYILDLKNKEIIHEISLNSQIFVSEHSLVQIGKTIYVFGGIHSAFKYETSSTFSNLIQQVWFVNSSVLTCKFGEIVRGVCKLCEPGTYYQNFTCRLCPTGTFNPYEGASSRFMCIPCSYGEFNDKLGNVFCKVCQSGSFCPIGSSHEQSKVYLLSSYSNQPENLNENDVIGYLNFMWIFLALAIFIALIILSLDNSRKFFKLLDSFSSKHSQNLNSPVIYRKTVVGGYFTVIFIIFSILTSIYTFISYIDDNLVETKSLTPSITLKESIKSPDLFITITFHHFVGNCNSGRIEEFGLNYKSRQYSSNYSNYNCIIKTTKISQYQPQAL